MEIKKLTEKVIAGNSLTREEALQLVDAPLEELCAGADEIRKHFNGDEFDMCAILSVKGGRCSENCKFCAQSSCSTASIDSFEVRDADYVSADAKKYDGIGVARYCQVSSGRRLNKKEVAQIAENIKRIVKDTNLKPCVSLGLIDREDLRLLKAAGLQRVHNNIESSPKFFGQLCSTHTTDDKIEVMKMVHEEGIELCSGGVFGVGESWEDRIDMAFALSEIKPESVPINMLKPIKGTPMGDREMITEEELRRIIAIFKYILPESFIRFAAGRDVLEDSGMKCFAGGSNATITGNMLTVKGVSMEEDLKNIRELGYKLA